MHLLKTVSWNCFIGIVVIQNQFQNLELAINFVDGWHEKAKSKNVIKFNLTIKMHQGTYICQYTTLIYWRKERVTNKNKKTGRKVSKWFLLFVVCCSCRCRQTGTINKMHGKQQQNCQRENTHMQTKTQAYSQVQGEVAEKVFHSYTEKNRRAGKIIINKVCVSWGC